MKIHHMGYLTTDLMGSFNKFKQLGFKMLKQVKDENQDIDLIFMINDAYIIELVCPFKNTILKESFVKKFKNKFYHIAFEVPNIDTTIKEIKNIFPVTQKMPATAFGNKYIQFFLTNTGLIEFIEQ